jgi:phytoene synthase
MPMPGAERKDLAAVTQLLRNGSHSFYAASLLLPKKVRDPAIALYAFCRVADDEIDLGLDRKAALARLTQRLDDVYRGAPAAHPVDRAFAATVVAHGIPKCLPAALLDGLAWDAEGRRYDTLSELLDYAARVAGSVGVMMALLMGVRDAAALARAADLGMAMQLTNIARDVGEDARAGRLYLPLNWLAAAGISVEGLLREPQFTPALGSVVRRLLAQADVLYASGGQGISTLPFASRPGIAAARRIYAAIGGQVAARRFDSVSSRARVSMAGKMLLIGRALLDGLAMPWPAELPTLPQIQFLVGAVAPLPPKPAPEHPGSLDKILNIFERLERAQREGGLA